MNGIVSRALVASAAAVAVVAACSSAAFAGDEPYGSRGQPPDARGGMAPQVIISAPARDVVTYEEKAPNAALIGSGALMFGLSYGSSVVVAAASDRASDEHLYIPLVGPWMDLTNRGPCRGIECGVNETANKVLLVTDGVVQGIGALQILGGFLFPETRTVTRTAAPGVHFTPTGGMGSIGVAAYGSF